MKERFFLISFLLGLLMLAVLVMELLSRLSPFRRLDYLGESFGTVFGNIPDGAVLILAIAAFLCLVIAFASYHSEIILGRCKTVILKRKALRNQKSLARRSRVYCS